jgi:hypothetical protein
MLKIRLSLEIITSKDHRDRQSEKVGLIINLKRFLYLEMIMMELTALTNVDQQNDGMIEIEV